MKTIKFYPSDRSLIKLDGKLYRGYTLNDVPYCAECGLKNQQEDKDEDIITYGNLDESTKRFIYREL